ncbi:GTP cyclohydrolase [Mycobacterium sp. 1554424.7]|nr:GTP cyclohydrolase [Mycobacterium sp. 1554424.7]
MTVMPDIQGESDSRGIEIDEVGISGFRQPTQFDDDVLRQAGIADFEVTVRLPANRRGTHMSRMAQVIQSSLTIVSPEGFPSVLKALVDLLEVDGATIVMAMPLATEVTAPVSGESGWQVHEMRMTGNLNLESFTLATEVTTDVTTLCPCSKAISDYGAHNQRCRVSLTVFGDGDTPYPLSVASMIEIIRSTCSCPVLPVVKRSDERALTMTAYENPMFAEDLVRDVSLICRGRGVAHTVRARTLESIHSHDAVATVSWGTG